MSLLDSSYWTLRIDPLRAVPLIPEEPEDFVHEISGKILCADLKDDRDRIAGRFRLYYADFELARNHGTSAVEVLDAYQHTLEVRPGNSGSEPSSVLFAVAEAARR
jgi:hypothetical protein